MPPVARRLAPLLLALVAVGAQAEVIESRRSVTVTLSEADTVVDARRRAQIDLQRQAAAEAGTFIEARAELRDGDLREAVTGLVAATVELRDVEERIAAPAGAPQLTLTATTRVDRASVDRRIAALRDDDALRRQILQLTAETAALERELARARGLVGHDPDPTVELAKVRLAQSRLNQGRDRVRQVVLSLAPAAASAENDEILADRAFAPVHAALEEALFEPLLRMPVHVEPVNLRRSVDGRHWVGELRVSFRHLFVDRDLPVCKLVHCRLTDGSKRAALGLSDQSRPEGLAPGASYAYLAKLSRVLLADKVMLSIRMGSFHTATPIYLPGIEVQAPYAVRPLFEPGSVERLDASLLAIANAPSSHRDPLMAEDRVRLGSLVQRADFSIPVRIPAVSESLPAVAAEVVRLPADCSPESNLACDRRFASFRMPAFVQR